MKSAQDWFNQYARTHCNPVNQKIHFVCVPAIFWSVVAAVWSIPVPSAFPLGFNWAYVVWLGPLMFYLMLGLRFALIMLIYFAVSTWICRLVVANGLPLFPVAAVVFVTAWLGQFYGHKVEGAKPAFFEDLQFLLVGPLWTLRKISKR